MKNRSLAAVISAILIITLSCSLCGCMNKKASTPDVHVFYYTYSDSYISGVRAALDQRLKDAGISYQDYDSNNNQTTQTEQIRTAITKGAKLLVVNIVNTSSDDAANGIAELAAAKGIPVIFFNREVSDKVITKHENCVFVGTDAKEAGILQGEMIGDYLVKNFDEVDLNKDGNISYILFKGEEGNNEAIFRTMYSVDGADKILAENGRNPLVFYDGANPNKYLVDKNGQWSAVAANEYMTTALTSYTEDKGNMIELVICNNDNMAEGAISALNSAGYNLGGTSKTIPVFGVDATEAAMSLISSGKMTGTIRQDAVGMAQVIAMLCENGLDKDKSLLEGTESLNVDKDVSKVRIPYSRYEG